jgi:hypothetical protein
MSSSATSGLKKYKKIKYLGKGSYGAAILVELRADPRQKFVIKEVAHLAVRLINVTSITVRIVLIMLLPHASSVFIYIYIYICVPCVYDRL